MPMYEYKCGACGHVFERYSAGKNGKDEEISCATCGKGPVKKVFSTFASNCCGSGAGTASPSLGGGCGGNSSFS